MKCPECGKEFLVCPNCGETDKIGFRLSTPAKVAIKCLMDAREVSKDQFEVTIPGHIIFLCCSCGREFEPNTECICVLRQHKMPGSGGMQK